MDEIVGTWLTTCGGGPCTLEIRADGTYRQRYITATEGNAITLIDSGKVAFADGIFHFESTNGYCELMGKPDGFYQASLVFLDGKIPELVFVPAQSDGCDGRYRSYQYPMHVYDQ
jgi:hypothetical protein